MAILSFSTDFEQSWTWTFFFTVSTSGGKVALLSLAVLRNRNPAQLGDDTAPSK